MAGHTNLLRLGLGGLGVASRRPPQGLPHNTPGAEPHDARTGSVEACPWAAAWSGCATPTGYHTIPNVQARLTHRLLGSLAKNQMFAARQTGVRAHTDRLPALAGEV